MTVIHIGDRAIGDGHPCFIIAEAGVNHNGDLGTARALADAAKAAGADAVKFQTFRADLVATADAPKADYQRAVTDSGQSQLDMIRVLELSEADHRELYTYCRQIGIMFLSTAGDAPSADFLKDLGSPAIKTASSEVTNLLLLRHVARLGVPMLVSTGMSTLGEIETACDAIAQQGNSDVLLFHCLSQYPAPPDEVNLRAIAVMRAALGIPVGYSDHTPGIAVSLAAVALGACSIEKHMTLDRNASGPDHRASLEPHQFEALVDGIRVVEAALGDGRKRAMPSEASMVNVARRSLVAAIPIPAGATLTETMVTAKRPGTGLQTALLPHLVGRRARRLVPQDAMLTFEMFE